MITPSASTTIGWRNPNSLMLAAKNAQRLQGAVVVGHVLLDQRVRQFLNSFNILPIDFNGLLRCSIRATPFTIAKYLK